MIKFSSIIACVEMIPLKSWHAHIKICRKERGQLSTPTTQLNVGTVVTGGQVNSLEPLEDTDTEKNGMEDRN